MLYLGGYTCRLVWSAIDPWKTIAHLIPVSYHHGTCVNVVLKTPFHCIDVANTKHLIKTRLGKGNQNITYRCCFSGVNVLANWHVPVEWKRLHKTPPPFNWCHHLNGVSNIWELFEIYIYLAAPYWCNRWPSIPTMFMAWTSYYSIVINHSRDPFW